MDRNYQLLVFDWDGTLMDSGQRIVNCFTSTASDLGLAGPNPVEVKSYIGIDLGDAWQKLYPGLDKTTLSAAIARYREYWIYLDQTPMPLYEGVEEGLKTLNDHGYWLSVATGKSRAGLDRVLQNNELNACFVYTRCADEARSKPHPQMLLDTLEYTGSDKERAIMIGDTTFDMEMAKNADMHSLAVGYGYHHRDSLIATDCRTVVDRFDDVVDFFISG